MAKLLRRPLTMSAADFQRRIEVLDERGKPELVLSTRTGWREDELEVWLRAHIDHVSGAVRYDVFGRISHPGSSHYYRAASFLVPSGETRMVRITSEGRSSAGPPGAYGDQAHTEAFSFPVDEADLRAVAAEDAAGRPSIWELKIKAETGGGALLGVVTPEVAGLIQAVDARRAREGAASETP